jgi:hypothetical protein
LDRCPLFEGRFSSACEIQHKCGIKRINVGYFRIEKFTHFEVSRGYKNYPTFEGGEAQKRHSANTVDAFNPKAEKRS